MGILEWAHVNLDAAEVCIKDFTKLLKHSQMQLNYPFIVTSNERKAVAED